MIVALRIPLILLLLLAMLSPAHLYSQAKTKQSAKTTRTAKPKQPISETYAPGPLFQTDEVLEFTLTGKLKDVFNDRSADTSTYYPMLLNYTKANSTVSLPIRVKTRGNFRRMRDHCFMPPLMINMARSAKLKSTVFEKQDKLKLVTPCRGDEFVIREYLVYKLYNLLSPDCMKARLAKVTFVDSVGKVKTQTQYCILLEDEDRAARRNGYFIMDKKMVRSEQVKPDDFTRLAVFQYLIGNTDWSVPYLHNIRLAYKDSNAIPVAMPYDFDHSGIVSAPYAMPPEQLGMSSVRERRYRGYCQDISQFQSTFALFNKMKDSIYALFTSCPYISERYVKTTTKFLDDFYKTINNPKAAEREFTDPCRRQDRIAIGGYQNASN